MLTRKPKSQSHLPKRRLVEPLLTKEGSDLPFHMGTQGDHRRHIQGRIRVVENSRAIQAVSRLQQAVHRQFQVDPQPPSEPGDGFESMEQEEEAGTRRIPKLKDNSSTFEALTHGIRLMTLALEKVPFQIL